MQTSTTRATATERVLRSARRPLNGLLRTPLVRALVTPRTVDDYLELLDPTWSVHQVRARLLRIEPTTSSALSLWLEPNELWRGFRAGQYVALTVQSGGVQHSRCFSISSAPEDGLPLRLTIQRVEGGRVSGWLAHEARVGDVVGLSQAEGDFVLDGAAPQPLLFVTAGSGITPAISLARHLQCTGYTGALHWLHYARGEVILHDELLRIGTALPHMRLHIQRTDGAADSAGARHFSGAGLEAFAPRWADCQTYACGPAPLLEAVTSHFEAHGLAGRLHVERFAPARPRLLTEAGQAATRRLVFQKSGREHDGHGGDTLLAQAEAAGLAPRSGCRMGICHSCVCRKVSGVVRDARTGKISDGPNENIQLCITTPESDVVLDI